MAGLNLARPNNFTGKGINLSFPADVFLPTISGKLCLTKRSKKNEKLTDQLLRYTRLLERFLSTDK